MYKIHQDASSGEFEVPIAHIKQIFSKEYSYVTHERSLAQVPILSPKSKCGGQLQDALGLRSVDVFPWHFHKLR